MGEQEWNEKTTATTIDAADTLLFLDDDETNDRDAVKQISFSDFLAGNESGDLTIKNSAPGNNTVIQATNTSSVVKTLMTANSDDQTCDFMAITEDIVSISSDSDAVDVAGKGIVSVNTSGGNVTIGGLANGVLGQSVDILKPGAANSLILEHNEPTGTQKMVLYGGADLTFNLYGGIRLRFTGSNWYQIGGP